MKLSIFIDENHDEEIVIFAHEKTALITEIEQLISANSANIMAYNDKEIIKLNLSEIYCFITENNKLFALTQNDKLLLKTRLYNVEEIVPDNFIKINKSCIANIEKIDRFNASLAGALQVKFKNGYIDYVSRRNVKSVKERLGL